MSDTLHYLLVADGTSDRALVHVIDWLFRMQSPNIQTQSAFFATTSAPKSHGKLSPLASAIMEGLKLGPNLDALFIHRDGEREDDPIKKRRDEIGAALSELDNEIPAHVCVIPVRMTEAWFLFDEQRLREAAGNPYGKAKLNMPSLKNCENMDAKKELYKLLTEATELSSRKRKRFNPAETFHRLAQRIDDFSPLRQLPSFQAFEDDLLHSGVLNDFH